MKIFSKSWLSSHGVAVVLIALFTLLIYANSLENRFVWDDYLVIADNDFVKSPQNLPLLFSPKYLTSPSRIDDLSVSAIGSGEASYRPVVTFTYFLDYQFWKLNPFGYHRANVGWHLLNGFLLYFLAHYITTDPKTALLTALLFVTHPVHSEVVNVVSLREDLLALFFMALAFLLYIKRHQYKAGGIKWVFFLGICLFYLLALFSKESAITLIGGIFVYDYLFIYGKNLRDIFVHRKRFYAVLLAISFFYLWVWSGPMARPADFVAAYPSGHWWGNVLVMAKILITDLVWLVFPLAAHVVIPTDTAWAAEALKTPIYCLLLIALIGFFCLAIKRRQMSRAALFAVGWFVLTLLPVLNVLPLQNIIAARYLYVPSFGFCLLIAMGLRRIEELRIAATPNVPQGRGRDLIFILLIFFSVVTIVRNYTWENELTFRLQLQRDYPSDPAVYKTLGAALMRMGLDNRAIEAFRKAIQLDPNDAIYYNDLGIAYSRQGKMAEATEQFQKAVERDASLKQSWNNLCNVLAVQKQWPKTIACFSRLIEHHPGFVEAYFNLGIAYVKMGNREKAEECFKNALMIDPDYQPATHSLQQIKTGQL